MFLINRIEAFLQNKGNCLISFVGGGGKTTTIYTLSQLLDAPVLVTTTTAMFTPTNQQVSHIFFEPSVPYTTPGQVVGFFKQLHPDTPDKVKGVNPQVLDQLLEADLQGVILNEADGANRKPIKAYAPHEPVIPINSDIVVVVIGLDVMGKPINSQWVHRLDYFLERTESMAEELMTWTHLLKLLNHPKGYIKSIPEKAEVYLLLNKYDQLKVTEGLCAFIEEKPNWIDKVIVASMNQKKEIGGYG